jgi:hypothetical protein
MRNTSYALTTRLVAENGLYLPQSTASGPPPLALVANGIIFRPGGVAGGNVYTTWVTVMGALTAVNGAVTVYVDSSIAPAVVPPGTWNGLGCAVLEAYNDTLLVTPPSNPIDILTIADGGTLFRWKGLRGALTVRCTCTTTQAFLFNYGPLAPGNKVDIFFVELGAQIIMLAGAAVAAIQVIPNGLFGPIGHLGATFDATASPGFPIVALGAAAGLLTEFFDEVALNGEWISGPVGSNLKFGRDDTVNPLTSAIFLGTLDDTKVSIVTNESSGGAGAGMVATADGTGGVIWALPSATDGVIFRPGGVAAGNVYTTWATAFAAVTATNATTTLYIDSSIAPANVPPGTYDGKGALTIAGYNNIDFDTLTIEDGATLADVLAFSGLMVVCQCVTTQAISIIDGGVFYLDRFANLSFMAGALVPAIEIAPGNTVVVIFDSGAIDNTLAPTVGFIDVAVGARLLVGCAASWLASSPLTTGNEISGPVGATVEWQRSDVIPPMTSTLFHGTVQDDPADPHIGANGTAAAPAYSFVADSTSGVYFNGSEVVVAQGGGDSAAFTGGTIPKWRQPFTSIVPFEVLQPNTFFYSCTLAVGNPGGAVANVGGQCPTTFAPPLQGALTGQSAAEMAVRAVTQTTQPVGGAGTASVAFALKGGTFNGRIKVEGKLITPGVGGGTAGDSFAQDWFVRAKTIAGVTSFYGSGTTADGPTDNDPSLAGAAVTFAVAGDTVVVTVGGVLASGSGAVVNWQLDIRGFYN